MAETPPNARMAAMKAMSAAAIAQYSKWLILSETPLTEPPKESEPPKPGE